MKSIVERTADDIKKCSSMCDTYSKKKLMAKVFRGPAWNVKLLQWVTVFSDRRKDFEFELSIHTGQGVDKANTKLDAIDEKFEYPRISSGYVLNCDTGSKFLQLCSSNSSAPSRNSFQRPSLHMAV
jgi:hypothetical protein